MMQRKRPHSAFFSVLPEILLFVFAALAFLLALLLPLTSLGDGFSADEQRLLDAQSRGEVVRIHILAASDHPEHQRIKLLVRDGLLAEFGALLAEAGCSSPEAALRALEDHLSRMHAAAVSIARKNGFNWPVAAEVGLMHMPEKQYGQGILPEGEYHGLRITLGDGAGQNWWCILFPELCLDLLTDHSSAEPPAMYWDSLRILRLWTLLPPSDTLIIPNPSPEAQH